MTRFHKRYWIQNIPIAILWLGVSTELVAVDGFTNHGVAVPVARSFGGTLIENQTGERLLLSWIGDHSAGSTAKLVVDVDSGRYFQIDVNISGWDTAKGSLLSSRNRWYTNFGNRFFEFCPEEKDFIFMGQTDDRSAYALTEDSDGIIWGVQRHNGTVISYNPDTRELRDHGSGHVEEWSQYARTIAADDDGWIYAGISVVAAQIVAYNSQTNEHRMLLADNERERGSGRVIRGSDGGIYATAPGWGWHRLRAGEAFPVEGGPSEEASDIAVYEAARGFVVEHFSDGTRLKDLNVPDRRVVFEDPDGHERVIEFDYDTPGARVYSLLRTPDGMIYGGSGHPTHIFRFDPATDQLEDNHMYRGAHYNALIWHDGYIYTAIYLGGGIDRYDPAIPWDPQVNPRRVMEDSQPELVRPSVFMAHPDGRHLVMAGSPRGGRTAAGLSIFDTVSGQKVILSNRDLLKDHNTVALLPLENGDLLGVTTTQPGTGGKRRAETAELYILDWNNREVIWHEPVLADNAGFRDMIWGPDELYVFGITGDSRLFVFDPLAREVIHEDSMAAYGDPSGSQAPRIMAVGGDGMIYVLFRRAIAAINPVSFEHHLVTPSPVDIRVGIVIQDGRIYFATQSELWSYQIP